MKALWNDTKGRLAVRRLEVADTFGTRFRGLLGRGGLPAGDGLLLVDCGSVHMFFMRFAIDAVFIDRGMRVLKVAAGLKPWRLASCARARHTLELPAGAAAGALEPGDALRVVDEQVAAEQMEA